MHWETIVFSLLPQSTHCYEANYKDVSQKLDNREQVAFESCYRHTTNVNSYLSTLRHYRPKAIPREGTWPLLTTPKCWKHVEDRYRCWYWPSWSTRVRYVTHVYYIPWVPRTTTNLLQGDVMKLQIRVDPTNNTISDVKFKTFGCGSAIASSSYLTELVRGMTLEEAGRVRNTEIAKELCLPPVKRKSMFNSARLNLC